MAAKLKLFDDIPEKTNKPIQPVNKKPLSFDDDDDDNEPASNVLEQLLLQANKFNTAKPEIEKQQKRINKSLSIVDKLITIQNIKKDYKNKKEKDKQKKEYKTKTRTKQEAPKKEEPKKEEPKKEETKNEKIPENNNVDPIFGIVTKKRSNKNILITMDPLQQASAKILAWG